MLLLLCIQGEGRVVGEVRCLLWLQLLLLLLRLGAMLVARVVSILRGCSILFGEGWVLVEKVWVSSCVFCRVPLEVLLAKAYCVAHQVVTVAILVWQTQLRDELRIGHQALHAPMLLAS